MTIGPATAATEKATEAFSRDQTNDATGALWSATALATALDVAVFDVAVFAAAVRAPGRAGAVLAGPGPFVIALPSPEVWMCTRYSWFSGPRYRASGATRQASTTAGSSGLACAASRPGAACSPASQALNACAPLSLPSAPSSWCTATCHTTLVLAAVSGPRSPRATSRIDGSWIAVTSRSQTRR